MSYILVSIPVELYNEVRDYLINYSYLEVGRAMALAGRMATECKQIEVVS